MTGEEKCKTPNERKDDFLEFCGSYCSFAYCPIRRMALKLHDQITDSDCKTSWHELAKEFNLSEEKQP